jgi:antitoxin (DNA-binding transcriptional repressor) of toxin-antitoxin stability system
MKYVTASEARKNWFKLLDEAAKGEVIAIQRHDKRLVLRLDKKEESIPDYERLISVPDADEADKWAWTWTPSKGLKFKKRK